MDDSSDIMSNMTHGNIKVTYICYGVYSLGWHGLMWLCVSSSCIDNISSFSQLPSLLRYFTPANYQVNYTYLLILLLLMVLSLQQWEGIVSVHSLTWWWLYRDRWFCLSYQRYVLQATLSGSPCHDVFWFALKILPLLLESLQLGMEHEGEVEGDGGALQASILGSLCWLAEDSPTLLSSHIPTLLPRLLQLSQCSPHMVSLSAVDVDSS